MYEKSSGYQLFIIKPLVSFGEVLKKNLFFLMESFQNFRELYLDVCQMHLLFCSSSALRTADFGLRLRAKCLTGWGRGPVAATSAVLFKN